MLIELGIIEYKIILPFLYPFLFQIRRLFHQNDKTFYRIFTTFLGYLFSGFAWIIIEHRTKRSSIDIETVSKNQAKNINERNQIDNTFKQIDEKNQKDKEKRIKGKYLYLFKLNLIYLFPMILETYTSEYINFNFKASIYLFYNIFFYILFSRIILHLQIYKHQLLSIIIIIVCLFISLIFYFTYDEKKDKYLLFNSFFLLFTGSFYSLFNTLEKRYYNIYMDSPYHFMFIIGFISLSILIPYEIFTLITFGDNAFNGIVYQIKLNFNEYSYLYLLLLIGDVFVSFLWVTGIHLIFTFYHLVILLFQKEFPKYFLHL